MDSILTSIKKLLGMTEDYEAFDTDIIMYINSAFSTLNQLGVGPKEGFVIEDETAVWSDFLGDKINLETVKTYIYLKVRIMFDPPTSSAVLDATERMIKEHEFRLMVAADPVPTQESEEDNYE